MRKWKKTLCAALSVALLTGSTANASSYNSQGVSSKALAQAMEVIQKESSEYIKNYSKINDISESTILGADFSYYQQDLEWSKIYYDYKSNTIDNVFTFVKSQGVNTISVRVVVNAQGDFAYLSLENAKKTIKAAKEAGLDTNMILMYSDGITYKDMQTLPEGWTEENAAEQAKEYTANVLSELEKEDILPTMITVGNEVEYNFLNYSADEGWNGWKAMGDITKLIKEKSIKVAIGVAAQDDPTDIQWVLEKLDNEYAAIMYDYVGVGIYPNEDTIGYMEKMRTTFAEKANNKQLFVSSVKYPRISSTDATVGVKSQTDNIYKLLSATIDNKNAGGLIYEEAEFVGSWNSFFDNDGHAQTSLAIFAYAQGQQVDVDQYRDPFQYGDDTGLKDQKVTIKKIAGMSDNAIRGMDIGSYIALKEAGVKYYNYKGEEQDLLKILSDNGVNYIRIRIWNNPYNEKGETYGGGNSDVETGLKIANEAKKYGMKLLLCFHYSDFWADPGVQLVPKAWKNDVNSPEKMRQNVYDFTKDTVQKFKDAGADIGMVQVGNEITKGMLGIRENDYNAVWPNPEKSSLINSYISAGSKAVREVVPDALIALHLESLNVARYSNIMNTWERDGVDYDVLGTSFYPFWAGNSKSGALNTLKNVQKMVQSRGKLFTVLETSWLSTVEDSDGTPNSVGASNNLSFYDVSAQGQVDSLTDIYETVMSQENGLGAFYWEPAWIPVKAGWANWKENKEIADKLGTGWASQGALGYYSNYKLYYQGNPTWGGSSWDNHALFDQNGNALQSLKFYKDSIYSGKEQTSVIHLVDMNGNEIASSIFAKVYQGASRNISIPKVSGYLPMNQSSTFTVTGEEADIKHYYVKYVKVQEIKSKKNCYAMQKGDTFNLGSEITLNMDSKLKYSSSNSEIVSIDANTGKMTAKGVGTAVITIASEKTDYMMSATKQITVNVSAKVVPTINVKKNSYKMVYGDTVELGKDVTLNVSGKLNYSSNNSGVVSIDKNTGKMKAKQAGTAVITITAANATAKKVTVTVSPKIVLKNKGVQNVAYGSSYKLSSYMTISGKCTKTFTSSNQSIAKVNSSGTITALKTGKVTITAKITGAGSNTNIQKKVTVYVVPKKQKISKVTPSSKALTVRLNKDKYASGYQVMVATNKNFTANKKSVYIKKNSTLSTKVSGLKAGKQYYVRVRSYKTISQKNYYGNWSTVVAAKTKK